MRILIYGLPLALILLVAATFSNVHNHPPPRKNAMVIGVPADPQDLNPIQTANVYGEQIADLVFDGLLAFDEDLNITGRLAESWNLTQTSTIFFANETQAAEAAAKVETLKDRWEAWGLLRSEQTGAALRLSFSKPGASAPREIFELIKGPGIDRLVLVRVDLKSSARESFAHFAGQSKVADRIKRVWFESNTAFEVTFVDSDSRLLQELKAYYAANADLSPAVRVKETIDYVDEPELNFKLRKDASWHDGYPVTAKDVEFTWRKIMDETLLSPLKPDFNIVQTVETPTLQDVRIIYRRSYSPVLDAWMTGILPEHILAGKDRAWWAANFNRSPIGTGAFKFGRWERGNRIELVKNNDYFRGAPHLDAITFLRLPDPAGRRLAFETRRMDFWRVDPRAVRTVASDPRFAVFTSLGNGYTFVGWNLRKPLFRDVRVRRALARATDVDAMIREVLNGYGQRCTGMWDPRMWWFNHDVKPLEYDPEEARALLAEAGWKPGADGTLRKDGRPFEFVLLANEADRARCEVATLLQAALARIGVRVTVRFEDAKTLLADVIGQAGFDACVFGWTYGLDYDQYRIWHSSQTGAQQMNFFGYYDAEVDTLLERIRSACDPESIKRMAGAIQKKVCADQPCLFLYVPFEIDVMWKDAFRVRRPVEAGWLDEPVRLTKAGCYFYREYFYRPEYAPQTVQR